MPESASPPAPLAGKAILVVEDEYALASDLEQFLAAQGAAVVGPVGTLKGALATVERCSAGCSAPSPRAIASGSAWPRPSFTILTC